jgi:hypothetical protein
MIGPSAGSAAIAHQKNVGEEAGKFETSGVSTSTDRNVAVRYATRNGTTPGHVAVIERVALEAYGVKAFDVVNECSRVRQPEDAEVILYTSDGSTMPQGLIASIEEVLPSDLTGNRGF